ncbi:MAG: ATP synthase F1 subunit epsilon, partial [Chloroflexi bacterium]|nr:ATP synthase F1 subunit epsilon [Chloroflexota bacterium]
PSHAALMTMLQPGELRYRTAEGESYLAVHGGFMEVRSDHVIVLADAAEHVDSIDAERAEEAVRRAEERIAARGADMDIERALASLRRAQVRVRITRRRRQQGHSP